MHPKIKEIRTSRGITQAHVAREMGVTQQTLSKWERGKAHPSIVQAHKLAALLFVEVGDLYEQEE